jgi:hypothetical protein
MQNKTNDVRRDLYNLRFLIQTGEYLYEDGQEIFHTRTTGARADEIGARLPADGPINTIVIETPTGRYQIEIGDTLVIRTTSTDALKSISITPLAGNVIELRAR